MKKQIIGSIFTLATLVVHADVIDGEFNTNQNATGQPTITTNELDLGWYGPVAQTASVPGVYVTGRSQFNDLNYWVGQIYTDSNATKASTKISFDVAYDAYTSKSVTAPQVLVEVYGSDSATSTTAFDLQENAVPVMNPAYTQIGSQLVYDVSGGLGSYSQTLDFGATGYDYIAVRIGIYATGEDGGWGEDIGIDNFSIVSVPEPSSIFLTFLGFSAIAGILRQRTRR